MFLLGMESACAQVNYSVDVSWNPLNCNCGTIASKQLMIEVWDISGTPSLIDADTINVSSYGTSFTYNESGQIYTDCEGCYFVKTKIQYFDGEGECCVGTKNETFDGDILIGGAPVSILMY
jgi:hypothetical protein